MSKLEPPGVVLKIVDHSEFDPTAPMSFSVPPTGPMMVDSPEELDDLTDEPRGTTREMLRATGARRITAIGRIKVPAWTRGLSNEPERV